MSRSGDPKTKPKKGVSRRAFMSRGAGLAISSPILATTTAADVFAQAGAKVLGPAPVPLSLRINGSVKRVTVEPRVTLLDALRNHLDLTGAKKVCDRGTCGACTVIMDGKPVYACSRARDRGPGQGRSTTVEGLADRRTSCHPVQAAFVENDAQQCGFCTPGFVMACKAFLDKQPQAHAGRGGRRPGRQPLPLRHLRRHPHRPCSRAAKAQRREPCLITTGPRQRSAR